MNFDNKKMTFVEHLEEFRKIIISSILSFLVASIIAYYFRDPIFAIITKPVGTLVFLTPTEAFLAYIKISLLIGLILSSPIIFYNIWIFISPALYGNEKKFVGFALVLALFLFLVGIIFAYFILPSTMKFLLAFGSSNLKPMISVNYYLGFILILFLACGISFEMPVAIMILTKLKIINSKLLIKKWKYAILLIFILAAVLTPTPDVFTQIIVAIPMIFLYIISILIAKIMEK